MSRETHFGECFLDNRVLLVEDPARITKPVVLPAPGVEEPRSFVHVPIATEAHPIGVLSVYSSTGRVYFSPELLPFLRTVAVQLGLGIQNAQFSRELGVLSHPRQVEAIFDKFRQAGRARWGALRSGGAASE